MTDTATKLGSLSQLQNTWRSVSRLGAWRSRGHNRVLAFFKLNANFFQVFLVFWFNLYKPIETFVVLVHAIIGAVRFQFKTVKCVQGHVELANGASVQIEEVG